MSRSRQSYLIAGLIALAIIIWMLTGLLTGGDTGEEQAEQETRQAPRPTLVQTETSTAQPITKFIVAHGEANAFHSVNVKAETAGRTERIAVAEGARIAEGQLLIQLSMEAREAQLEQRKAELNQLETELAGARELAGSEYGTEQRVRQLEAQVAGAKAAVARIEEEIRDTAIEAPFDGVVNTISAEPGEFVSPGQELAVLIDNDPLKVVSEVSQQSVAAVELGSIATVSFATERAARGRICFISSAADPQTRTFNVEVWVANPDHQTPSGISAELRIPAGRVEAHKISPAILSLSTDGQLGIKSVTDGKVQFHNAQIVRSETDGVWISGVPNELDVISVGQGFVQAGETVRIAEKRSNTESDAPDTEVATPTATSEQAAEPEETAGDQTPPSCEQEQASQATAGQTAEAGGTSANR